MWHGHPNREYAAYWESDQDLRDIICAAADKHQVSLPDIRDGDIRSRRIVAARREAARNARAVEDNGEPRWSYPVIARAMGLRSHTSVIRLVNATGAAGGG